MHTSNQASKFKLRIKGRKETLKSARGRFESKGKPFEVYVQPVQANQENMVKSTWSKVEGRKDKSGNLCPVTFGDSLKSLNVTPG